MPHAMFLRLPTGLFRKAGPWESSLESLEAKKKSKDVELLEDAPSPPAVDPPEAATYDIHAFYNVYLFI